MKRIVATGIALLSLSSVAEAHRLSGTATYYGGSDGLCGSRTASGTRLNCGSMRVVEVPYHGVRWGHKPVLT